MFRAVRSPCAAFLGCAVVACVWLNQGPSGRRYEVLVDRAARAPESSAVLRAWLPLAFLYRRSADEELYFAIANAIRGAPFDRDVLATKRGESTPAFRRAPRADGLWHMPYAEVPFEYPALLLPFILIPAAVAPSFDVFAPLFGVLMAALLLSAIHFAILAAPEAGPTARAKMWWCATALLLAQGALVVERLDAVATLFLALALWAAARHKAICMGLFVALAAAAKITPLVVIVPLCLADRATWRSGPALRRVFAGLTLGLCVGFVPMLLMSPRGFADFVRYHGSRGLQVESTYGTAISMGKSLLGETTAATLSFGSYNIDGPAAAMLARASSFLLLAAILALGVWIARGQGRGQRRLLAAAEQRRLAASAGFLALACIWLLGKVFSPQYLTWAIPFAIALQARRITFVLVAAMGVAQAYLRGFYDYVVAMRPLGVAALTLRTALLLTLAVLLGRAIAALQGARRPSPNRT